MIGEQAVGGTRALDAGLQIRIPPDVIDVDRHAQTGLAVRRELVAQRVRLRERVDAGAIRRVHRMERLDRERHAGRLRMQEQLADATGLTPVHVNRVLKVLEAEGLISRQRRNVQFVDWRALQDVGDFSRRYLHIPEAGARPRPALG